ncbi:hypothetical protein SAMN02910292_01233 [Lachnospiraceae bacterium XBB2008]|nr:hypothetical protein SAMN02910292_01233 [Lachnospiraceae bacterium XBB2008]
MDTQLREVFTDYVMKKWGKIFELDRNAVSASFDRLIDCSGKRKELVFKAWAYWSPYLVPSLLLDDVFITNVVNTITDDKPHVPDSCKDLQYKEDPTEQLIDISFERYDEPLWDMFFEIASEGFKAYVDLFKYQNLLIKDVSSVQFEFVQDILNHIGVMIYHFWTSDPFNIYINSILTNYPKWIVDYYASEWCLKHNKIGG